MLVYQRVYPEKLEGNSPWLAETTAAPTAAPAVPFSCDPIECPSHGPMIPMINMGVSENNVPLNPMVNDHYPY